MTSSPRLSDQHDGFGTSRDHSGQNSRRQSANRTENETELSYASPSSTRRDSSDQVREQGVASQGPADSRARGQDAGEREGETNTTKVTQLYPINTRLQSSSHDPRSASTSASSSTSASPRLSQHSRRQTDDTSSIPSQPSYTTRSTHGPSRQSSPASEVSSSSFSHNLAQRDSTSLLSSTSPSKWSPMTRPDQPYRSGSPSHSTGSATSSSRQYRQERSNEGESSGEGPSRAPPPVPNGSGREGSAVAERTSSQTCAKCDLPMTGQFVRALGAAFHLDCFRCQDCNKVVAAKFFPVDATDGSGRQFPLCETDYFRRLGLLCNKCGSALRGSYITALEMKFHVEHFTCSVCPTVFGPQDSYYEHDGSVYCHFHYSTRFAVKCTGCRTAILKQFVEINRNNIDEHWHPECYMIHKFWNIRLAPAPPIARAIESSSTDVNNTPVESSRDATGPPSRALDAAEYLAQEESETPASLKNRQKLMEEQVYRIWTVLSAFEESSAACISEMLRHVSSGQYIEGVRMAEKFVLHVETLFSAIDDLSEQFKNAGAKEIAHVREARMLCKKVVNFFSLLSYTHETGARKMSITQELLSLVTGLAHYLKILIRIALTAALKLEREHANRSAIGHFLGRLDRLARNPDASKFAPVAPIQTKRIVSNSPSPEKVRAYGYKSLMRAVGTLVGQGEATTDLCEGCKLTIEEECARFGTSLRWHLPCLRCAKCNKVASKEASTGGSMSLRECKIEPMVFPDEGGDGSTTRLRGGRTVCSGCSSVDDREGFEYVTRLEQYAFLLCVALNKLYALLKQRGVVPTSPVVRVVADTSSEGGDRHLYDAYRTSTDTKRMKFVSLDRQLSTTTSRMPVKSTIIQSPSGQTATSNEKPPVPSRRDQPQIDSPRRSSLTPISTRSNRDTVPPLSYRSLPPEDTTLTRPAFQRATTAIHIVDDQVPSPKQLWNDALPLGGVSEQTRQKDDGEQHRFNPPRSGILLSELSALEYFIVKHVAALMLASEDSAFRDVAPLDDLLEMIDSRKNTFWGKLFKGGAEKKSLKKKGVFGIPLDALVDRNGADSMHGAGPGSLRVPSFVDDCISAMKQMDMSVEGVFRKNGNIRRLKDLSEALDRDASAVNLSDENPVQLAALLKRFLRDLPDPLLTFKLFHLFIATQRVEDLNERKKMMHLVCCLLPKYHRDTMEVIFVFLKWVASFSHVDEETGSKMDLLNLATVVCPNILYSKGKDPQKDESFLAVRAVNELLEFQDEFWQVPEEFASILDDQDLFSNPSELTSKQILVRAENYVRKNSNSAPIRGFVHQPQRPDFQQAYSAPALDSRRRRPESSERERDRLTTTSRPVSFSTFAPSPVNSLPNRSNTSSPYRQPDGSDSHDRLSSSNHR